IGFGLGRDGDANELSRPHGRGAGLGLRRSGVAARTDGHAARHAHARGAVGDSGGADRLGDLVASGRVSHARRPLPARRLDADAARQRRRPVQRPVRPAPLAHHWQDGTHITFGVLTAGVFTRTTKLEASIFNGREPDEDRTNFDYAGRALDSYSARLSVNPGAHWSVSTWYAYLKSPET